LPLTSLPFATWLILALTPRRAATRVLARPGSIFICSYVLILHFLLLLCFVSFSGIDAASQCSCAVALSYNYLWRFHDLLTDTEGGAWILPLNTRRKRHSWRSKGHGENSKWGCFLSCILARAIDIQFLSNFLYLFSIHRRLSFFFRLVHASSRQGFSRCLLHPVEFYILTARDATSPFYSSASTSIITFVSSSCLLLILLALLAANRWWC
jgi:hypothetical protein